MLVEAAFHSRTFRLSNQKKILVASQLEEGFTVVLADVFSEIFGAVEIIHNTESHA